MATKVLIGSDLGAQICDALGISTDHALSMAIDLRSDCVASITVVRAIDSESAGKVVEVLKRYDLIEKPDK